MYCICIPFFFLKFVINYMYLVPALLFILVMMKILCFSLIPLNFTSLYRLGQNETWRDYKLIYMLWRCLNSIYILNISLFVVVFLPRSLYSSNWLILAIFQGLVTCCEKIELTLSFLHHTQTHILHWRPTNIYSLLALWGWVRIWLSMAIGKFNPKNLTTIMKLVKAITVQTTLLA